MKIHARPNLNGNTSDDFHAAAAQLLHAVGMARKALYAAQADVIHGRNYQTVDDAQYARTSDILTIQRGWQAAQQLAELASAISEATWEREASA